MRYLLYLFVLSSVLFVSMDWRVLTALLAIQILLWIGYRIPLSQFPMMFRRIWIFLVFIFLSYAFVSTGGEADVWKTYAMGPFEPRINLSGIMLALLMCERVLCLIMASIWVQHVATPKQLMAGLTGLGVPQSVAIAVKHAMALATGRSNKMRRQNQVPDEKPWAKFRRILTGDIAPVCKLLDGAFQRVDERLEQQEPGLSPAVRREITVMVSMALAMMSFKMIVIVPGLMVAPGHKNIILIPLFLVVAQRTQARFGGMWTGLCMGLVSFMMGFGKLGILELAQFTFTGFLADILLPMYRTQNRLKGILQLMLIGAMMGFARFSSNILLLILAGAPVVGLAILAPIVGGQIFFGALSAFPARALLKEPVLIRSV